MTLRERRQAVLAETIALYNLDNRATTVVGGCSYTAPNEKKHPCAVGRLCDVGTQIEMEKKGGSVHSVQYFLPTDVAALGIDFLAKLQGLHDSNGNWDATGLSDQGRDKVERIKVQFDLNN